MIAQGLPALGGALIGALTGPALTTYPLTPDATLANSGWTPVNAASVHEALATGDAEYLSSTTDNAVASVSLSNPPGGLVLTNATITIRHRITPL